MNVCFSLQIGVISCETWDGLTQTFAEKAKSKVYVFCSGFGFFFSYFFKLWQVYYLNVFAIIAT